MTLSSSQSASGSALLLSKSQRSHLLLVLSNPLEGFELQFGSWFSQPTPMTAASKGFVIAERRFRQHEVDITAGRHAPVTFDYLTIYELALDGGEEAADLIEEIASAYSTSGCAAAPATWLFFPIGDKVGQAAARAPLLTVAFANPIAGTEAAFREFYCTRHVRHALNIPALVSGQCLERAQFQLPGAAQPIFQAVALYEQTGEPADVVEAFGTLPRGTLDFPMLDKSRGRFSECTYRLLI